MKHNLFKKFVAASLTVALSIALIPFSNPVKKAEAKSSVPSKVLVGYWHNFNNGTGSIKLRDVSLDWDVINLSFGEGTSPSSGDIRFEPFNATKEEFKEDVKYLQSKGKKVLLSIGGQNGQVNLETKEAKDMFVKTVSGIIDTYGLDGLDIDFEGHSLYFNEGDKDLKNPTTPVIVNLISALNELCNKYGNDFLLTMAPETFFVQMGKTFYGGLTSGGADKRTGAYLPVIYALRDKLSWIQVQYYNSGTIKDLNGKDQSMGSPEFYVALMDMLLKGFPIMGDKNNMFPALRPDQVVLGVPACVNAGNGYVNNAGVKQAMDALINGGTVGGYTIEEGYPDLRGIMTWSVNWDACTGFVWSKFFRDYLDSLVPPTDELRAVKLSSSEISQNGVFTLSITSPARNLATSYEIFENGKSIGTGELKPSLTTTQTVKRDIANRAYGKYIYTVVVKDNAGNKLTSPEFTVELKVPTDNPNREDINNDKIFDILDLSEVGSRYNLVSGQAGFNANCDLIVDGVIDLYDLVKVASRIGTEYTPLIPNWESGVYYKLGDKVNYNGKTYVCTFAHTSNDGWLPGNVPTLWQEVK
ncbi:MAG: carbohydrate-binding protein [Clostridium sp.]